jgi:hypothetical protein
VCPDGIASAETERRLVVIFRKCFVPTLLVCAAVLAVSCEKNPEADVFFVTPTEGKRVPPDIVTVKVRCSAVFCKVESVALSVDGAHLGTNSSAPVPETCSFTWDASNVTPGTRPEIKAMMFTSYVQGGYDYHPRDSATVRVLVDTGGPGIRIVSPQDGDTVSSGNVPIVVWARDTSAAGMDRVEFLVDEVLKGTVSTGVSDTWRYTWDASQASPGSHAIKAKAYNGNGEKAVEAIAVAIRDTGSSGGPTHHHGYIDTSETWSPSGNPHIVDADVTYRQGALLTVEPGCAVKFQNNTAIYFGFYGPSGLQAIGTASAPILFTSNQASPAPGDWNGLLFGDSTTAGTRLSYCTIEYGGPHTYGFLDAAAIKIAGWGVVDEISDCTIRYGGMNGVHCTGSSGFGTFRNNVVTANLGYSLRIGPQLAERLNAGNTLTGNDSAGVELSGRLSVSTTWPDLGVPYVITNVTVGDSTNSPVLTIEPGTEVRFKSGGWLQSGKAYVSLPGRIVADGSADRIRFTSAAGMPVPGDYDGVHVFRGAGTESEFRSCDFAYGGQGGGYNSILYVDDCSPVIAGCDFGYSAGWGITFRTVQTPDTLTLKQVNTFHDNAEGDIKWMHLFPGPGD